MSETRLTPDAALDNAWLTLDELCRLARLSPDWVQARVTSGLLVAVTVDPPGSWRFDALALHRACRLAALERDFDALPELAALVADLEDEVGRLRQRLRR